MHSVIYLFIALLMCVSCASVPINRSVDNNTFSSSCPDIRINVNNDFDYIGNIEYEFDSTSVNGKRTLNNYCTEYIFVTADNNTVKKYVSVTLCRTETHYVSDLFSTVTDKLDVGVQDLGNKYFHFYTKLVATSMKVPFTKYLTDRGLIVPPFWLSKYFGRVVACNGEILIKLLYGEDIALSGVPYDQWQKGIGQGQRAFIEEFNQRCSTAFEILMQQ